MNIEGLNRIGDFEWEIPIEGDMLVPGRVFADKELIRGIDEKAKEQIINVACLPGIVKASMAMPDAHWGYGFPIGGVAAMDSEQNGVISMGGVGFDGGCGVKTLTTGLTLEEVRPNLKEFLKILFDTVPAGLGIRGKITLSESDMDTVLEIGAKWAVEQGYGTAEDLVHIEDGGCVEGANSAFVSQKARQRERGEIGTLGSGNHYLEIQYVDEIYDERVAKGFGLKLGDVLISIHCGSRALGYQIGTDYLRILYRASKKYGIKIRERELVSAPIDSNEGQLYLAAELCALNYSYANRQVIAHLVRQSCERVFPESKVQAFWDHTHNSARFEAHSLDDEKKTLLVHRKGSTRVFGPGREEVPIDHRELGQPALIGGTMGTYSFILCGTEPAMKKTFGSACHGAGRAMSRRRAKKIWWGKKLAKELKKQGTHVMCHSWAGLAEEAPGAYKDVQQVVDTVHYSGIARKVVRLRPLGTIKG